jgi:hypothetical protein
LLCERFLAVPGATEQDWNRVKDEVIARYLVDEAERQDRSARGAFARMYRAG